MTADMSPVCATYVAQIRNVLQPSGSSEAATTLRSRNYRLSAGDAGRIRALRGEAQ